MIKKVYLLWNSYHTNEILTIGSLSKVDGYYVFRFEEDAIYAMECGCMLPFKYAKEDIYFDSLPEFFTGRMQQKDMLNKLGIHYNANDELSILTAFNGRKNTDNFMIINEEKYETWKKDFKNRDLCK